jgi:hypothetical protein
MNQAQHTERDQLPAEPAQPGHGGAPPAPAPAPAVDGDMIRVIFEGERFDVAPAPVEEIRQTLAEHYPVVRAAAVEEGTATVDGKAVRTITFRKQVGTKGGRDEAA